MAAALSRDAAGDSSHDREFLDNVASHTLHLHDGRAKLYTGNYTAFERQRAEQLRQQQIAHDKEQVERAHLQSFIDRFKAKASKARQAQSRMRRLAKLAGTEAVRAERSLHIEFPQPARMPNSLVRLEHADCGYGATIVLHDVGFGLEAGDRIGLLGANGAGKSTLVKTLVGELPLVAGERNAHPDMRIGYFAQHTVESLRAGQSPIDHLRDLSPDSPTQAFRDFLGKWNFAGDRAFESIDGFSGGEKARLALALIAWRQPNVLLLDEPTNHLDLDMREALAEALSDFDGAIVLVSHDRHLIGLVCDKFVRVADGRVEPFDGDLDEYAAWLSTSRNDQGGKPKPARDAAKPAPAAPPAAPRINPHRLAKLEAGIAALESELATVEAQLAEAYAAGDPAAATLASRQQDLRASLDASETELLTLYEAA